MTSIQVAYDIIQCASFVFFAFQIPCSEPKAFQGFAQRFHVKILEI